MDAGGEPVARARGASSVPASPEAPAEEPQPIAFDGDGWAGHDSASGWPAPEPDESAPDEAEASAEAAMEGDAVELQEDRGRHGRGRRAGRPKPAIYRRRDHALVRAPPGRSGSTESPPEIDAAGEMEVASTGHRSRFTPEPGTELPGGEELDDALAGLDSLVGQRGPNAVDPATMPRLRGQPRAVGDATAGGRPAGTPAAAAQRAVRSGHPGVPPPASHLPGLTAAGHGKRSLGVLGLLPFFTGAARLSSARVPSAS